MKKVVVLFNSADFDARDYDQVWEGLKAAGQAHPKGLLTHVGFANPEGGWSVVDIWESAEAFGEFGKILVPIMQRIGKPLPEPKVVPAHYVYEPLPETAGV